MTVSLPDSIRVLRTTLEFSQERLARELGMTVRGVSRWEAGARPDLSTIAKLYRLADRFGRSDLGATVFSAYEQDVVAGLRSTLTDCSK